jgi:hypothetical protein
MKGMQNKNERKKKQKREKEGRKISLLNLYESLTQFKALSSGVRTNAPDPAGPTASPLALLRSLLLLKKRRLRLKLKRAGYLRQKMPPTLIFGLDRWRSLKFLIF